MDNTLDSLTKSFDKLFLTTIQNILGTNVEVCKWSFVFTSVGVGISMLINSFYFIKINNENNIIKDKVNLLLNENKLLLENNITLNEILKNNNNKIISIFEKNASLKNDYEVCGYDFLYCDQT